MMSFYDDYETRGWCPCAHRMFISGNLKGCSNPTCDNYVSHEELAAEVAE